MNEYINDRQLLYAAIFSRQTFNKILHHLSVRCSHLSQATTMFKLLLRPFSYIILSQGWLKKNNKKSQIQKYTISAILNITKNNKKGS